MLAIFLDIRNFLVVIVGAGSVARRKLQTLVGEGARIRMVAPQPRPEWFPESHGEWWQGEYSAEVLTGASLVIAAATATVNQVVVADALARGLWICDAAEPDRGNVYFPATLQQGRLTLAVSTGGVAPALAVQIRDRLAEDFDESFHRWLELLAEVRPHVRAQIRNSRRRGELLRDFARWKWLQALRRDGYGPVRDKMLKIVSAASVEAGDQES